MGKAEICLRTVDFVAQPFGQFWPVSRISTNENTSVPYDWITFHFSGRKLSRRLIVTSCGRYLCSRCVEECSQDQSSSPKLSFGATGFSRSDELFGIATNLNLPTPCFQREISFWIERVRRSRSVVEIVESSPLQGRFAKVNITQRLEMFQTESKWEM
ncbi:MAG: hypothetical protein GY903_30350 [Fuerstiella sp.]|nr:hypothetical protein [Fuerstiella sp.]MCP4858796.1 hypothetical protein [Fuerstiella sp.]